MRELLKKYPWLKYIGYIVIGIVMYKITLADLDDFESVASSLAFLQIIYLYFFYKFSKHREEIDRLSTQVEKSEALINTLLKEKSSLENRIELLEFLSRQRKSEIGKIKGDIALIKDFSNQIAVCESCKFPISDEDIIRDESGGDCTICGNCLTPNLIDYIPASESIINISKRLAELENTPLYNS
ncbi:MAG: hypothetical protein K1000chlam2_01282 [Chlamydiae bacterium]|nr:hypothetical protein [Chlamydiota bacterium]